MIKLPLITNPINGEKTQMDIFKKCDISWKYINWLNDPEVVMYSNNRFSTHDTNTSITYVNSFEHSSNNLLKISRLLDGEMIGTMTLYFNSNHKVVDVGLMIGDKKSWGKGYGKDAWISIINWLSTNPNVRKITAGALETNTGMIKIMHDSGMNLEAIKYGQELFNKKAVNVLYYAKFTDL